jgi:hypothetical protein
MTEQVWTLPVTVEIPRQNDLPIELNLLHSRLEWL